jgi:hypothetical protein
VVLLPAVEFTLLDEGAAYVPLVKPDRKQLRQRNQRRINNGLCLSLDKKEVGYTL